MLVTPMGKLEPLGKPAVCINETPAQLSVTVGASQLTTAEHNPGVLFTEIFNGHEVNTGGCASVTVTVNEQTLLFPLASVAVNATVVIPTGKADPLGKPEV